MAAQLCDLGLPEMTMVTVGGQRAPGPRGKLFLGSLSAFQRDSIGFLTDAARTYGDVVRMRFGPFTAHLVNHPDHIHHVLVRNASNYDKHTRSVAQIRETCGDSLLSANEAAWVRQRRLIQPVFQEAYVRSMLPIVDEVLETMLTRWSGAAQAQQPVPVVSEMLHMMIAASAKLLFSSSVDVDRIERSLAVVLEDTWRRLQAPFDWSMLSRRFHRRAFKAAVTEIDAVTFAMIAARRQSGEPGDDLLGRLLRAHEAEGAQRLDDRELRDASVTLLLAGHETTAHALAATFIQVAGIDEPDQRRWAPELLFAEALRLHPSIWIAERRVLADDVIGGYDIPRGSMLLISPYAMHRHPDYWEDPDRFDPGRFAEDRAAGRPRNAYIPFGIGKHRCVGLHMARLVAERVIASVQERFHLSLVQGQNHALLPGITLRQKEEVWLTVRPRT